MLQRKNVSTFNELHITHMAHCMRSEKVVVGVYLPSNFPNQPIPRSINLHTSTDVSTVSLGVRLTVALSDCVTSPTTVYRAHDMVRLSRTNRGKRTGAGSLEPGAGLVASGTAMSPLASALRGAISISGNRQMAVMRLGLFGDGWRRRREELCRRAVEVGERTSLVQGPLGGSR